MIKHKQIDDMMYNNLWSTPLYKLKQPLTVELCEILSDVIFKPALREKAIICKEEVKILLTSFYK